MSVGNKKIENEAALAMIRKFLEKQASNSLMLTNISLKRDSEDHDHATEVMECMIELEQVQIDKNIEDLEKQIIEQTFDH